MNKLENEGVDAMYADASVASSLAAIKTAAKAEIINLVDTFWIDPNDARDLVRAPIVFANDALNRVYQLPATNLTSTTFQRIDVSGNPQRGGLLGTAAYMLHTSHLTEKSDTLRGKYIRDVLFCEPLPAPPPGVQAEPSVDANGNPVPRSEATVCGACHKLMDPIGVGLPYDGVGLYKSPAGTAQKGYVYGLPNPEFTSVAQLAALVGAEDRTSQCMVRRSWQWLAGRTPAAVDDCTLRAAFQRFQNSGYKMTELWLGLMATDAFRYRNKVVQ